MLGHLFSGRIDMMKLKSEKVDTLVVSYGAAKAEIPVYWSWRQRQLAEIAAAMEALRQFYSAGLQNPNVSPAAKEQLHKRLNLIKNYDQVMAYEGEDFDDIRRLIAARGYFDMLQMDPAAWDPDYIPTDWAGTRNNRFGVLVGSRMEGEMLNRLEDSAKQEYFDRFARTMRDATIGLYQVVANASGVNQLLILRTGTDAMGRHVNTTEKWLAGIDLVSQAAMQGAVVLRASQVASRGAGGLDRPRIVNNVRGNMTKNVASDLILYGRDTTRVPGPRPGPGFRGRSTDTVPESGAGPPPRDFRSAPTEAATSSRTQPGPADVDGPGAGATTRIEPPPGSRRPADADTGSTSRIEPPPGTSRPNVDPEGTTILDSPGRSPRPADGDTGLTSRIDQPSGSPRPNVDPEGTTILDSPRRSPRPADEDTGVTSRIEQPAGSRRPDVDPEGTTILDSPRRLSRAADADGGSTSRIERPSSSPRPANADVEKTTLIESRPDPRAARANAPGGTADSPGPSAGRRAGADAGARTAVEPPPGTRTPAARTPDPARSPHDVDPGRMLVLDESQSRRLHSEMVADSLQRMGVRHDRETLLINADTQVNQGKGYRDSTIVLAERYGVPPEKLAREVGVDARRIARALDDEAVSRGQFDPAVRERYIRNYLKDQTPPDVGAIVNRPPPSGRRPAGPAPSPDRPGPLPGDSPGAPRDPPARIEGTASHTAAGSPRGEGTGTVTLDGPPRSVSESRSTAGSKPASSAARPGDPFESPDPLEFNPEAAYRPTPSVPRRHARNPKESDLPRANANRRTFEWESPDGRKFRLRGLGSGAYAEVFEIVDGPHKGSVIKLYGERYDAL